MKFVAFTVVASVVSVRADDDNTLLQVVEHRERGYGFGKKSQIRIALNKFCNDYCAIRREKEPTTTPGKGARKLTQAELKHHSKGEDEDWYYSADASQKNCDSEELELNDHATDANEGLGNWRCPAGLSDLEEADCIGRRQVCKNACKERSGKNGRGKCSRRKDKEEEMCALDLGNKDRAAAAFKGAKIIMESFCRDNCNVDSPFKEGSRQYRLCDAGCADVFLEAAVIKDNYHLDLCNKNIVDAWECIAEEAKCQAEEAEFDAECLGNKVKKQCQQGCHPERDEDGNLTDKGLRFETSAGKKCLIPQLEACASKKCHRKNTDATIVIRKKHIGDCAATVKEGLGTSIAACLADKSKDFISTLFED